jgi:magnesium chelatase family protein
MPYAKALAVGLLGLTGHLVEVEADVAAGLPMLTLTGLPDASLAEARDRVRAAVVNSGEQWPNRRITINLLPATLPKHGSIFDLGIATVILAGAGALPLTPLAGAVILGELGLDGAVRAVRGVLPCVMAAARAGITRVVVPAGNAREAALVPGVTVRATDSLRRLVDFVRGTGPLLDVPPDRGDRITPDLDLADVVGQESGRRALEVAAAGGHHMAMFGPPGAGKTMIAQRLPSILPPLTDQEAMEITSVHSIAGALPADAPLIRRVPFQAPHHTSSIPALVGGGSGMPSPGAISLAHLGVLFLDEAPEFAARALETLRQPLEDGHVIVARSRGTARYPARFQLIMAANPCPCASPAGDKNCQCTPLVRRRYLGRLSGPLMDRIDLRTELLPVTAAQLMAERTGESSAVVARRVADARAAARERWAQDGWQTNSQVPGQALRRPPWRLPPLVTDGLAHMVDAGTLSARGFDRVVRIAWSIADLAGRDRPSHDDVREATAMRMGQL